MNLGRFILVLLTMAALVVGAASLYWYADPWETGVAAAATHPRAPPPMPEVVSNITVGNGASLSGVRDLEPFAVGAGLYMVAAAPHGDAILVINVTDPYSPRVISYVADDGATALGGASAVDVVRIGSGTYGVVASASEDGLQVLNLTDPADPMPVAHITDDGMVALAGAYDVDIFAVGSGIYGVVASPDDGLQILNLTDPADPMPVAHITDDNTVALDGAVAVDTIKIGSGIYAVSASPDDGLQILNLTDPADPTPVASLTDDASVHLRGIRGVDTLALGSGTYAVAASDDGLQMVEITDPSDLTPLARVPDGMHAALRDASAVDTFMMNGITYAVVAAADGIVVVNLADPTGPTGPIPVEAAQNDALYGASAVKTFYVAGHVYVAAAVPDGGGAIRIVSLGEMDSVPPTVSSAIWAPADRTITLVFSEPLDHTATDYPGIILLGESANLTLADAAPGTAAGRTISATLGPEQEAALGMPEAVLLYEGSVRDTSANPLPPTHLEVTLPDSVPPTVSSATYEPGSGLLTISFSEPLNHTATIYQDIAVAGPIHGDALRISILLAFIYPDIVIADPVRLYTLDEIYIGAASDMTIQATLDTAQIEAVGSAPMLYMMEGAVVDISGNPIGAVRGLDVDVLAADAPDATPPDLVSSHYNTETGILNITFSEPLNGTAIHYDRMHIRDAGRSAGGLTMDDIVSRTLDANITITLTLSDSQRQTINDMAAPQLDIEKGAVFDISGNGISAASARPITVIDGIPPTVVSVDYTTGTGILVITFSEPLGNIDYSGVSVTGADGSVALDDAASSHSGDTITAVLDAAQRITAGISPTLSVSAGAVSDISGNPISPASNIQITVEVTPVLIIPDDPPRDTTPPRLLSSYYTTGTGALNMTFSEPLRSQINYTGIILVGPSQNLTLDTVTAKNHTIRVINATLDGPQRAIVGERPGLLIEAGAVSDRSGNRIPHTDGTLLVIDGMPPEFVSSYYNTGTGVINVTFNEPLVPTIHYDRMHIRDVGQAVMGLSLDDVDTKVADPLSSTMTLTLSDTQRRTVNDMATPQLDIGAGAVSDIGRNDIVATPNQPITVIDGIPPTVASVAYTTGSGILVVVFSEPLDHDATDYSGVIVTGPTNSVALSTVSDKSATGDRITATLNAAQRATAGDSPGLSVSAGAVSDIAGNPILSANPTVTTFDGVPPTISSSSYNTGTGILNIKFSETLNSTINYERLALRGPSQSVTLDTVSVKSASGVFIIATLDATQRATAGDSPTLSVSAGAVADLHGNPILSATPTLNVIDGIPPTFVSSYYNTGTGILNITFSEPLDTIHYGRIAVRSTGEAAGGLSLNAITDRTLDSSSSTMTLALSDGQRQRVNNMTAPQLDITADAVADPAGNGILAAPNQNITVIDGIRPIVTSAAYNTGTGILNIIFSETLDSTVTYSGIELAGENGNVALGAVSTKSHSDDTITATLDAAQRTTVGDIVTLSVSEGAVADTSDNDIAQTTISVKVTDGIPPTLVSSSYNTGTGILNMTFSESLSRIIHYDRMHIRDAGHSTGGISLHDTISKFASGATLSLILSPDQQTTIYSMDTPQLDIAQNAVFDISRNGIAAISDRSISIRDTLADAFITTWRTTAANQAIIIPTGGSNATFTINWGDGRVSTDVSGNVGRVYADPGNYTISITGGFERFILAQVPTNASMLMSIDQWGNASWTGMDGAFLNAANMVYRATDAPDLSRVTSMIETFRGASSFNGDLSSWDTSSVTDMYAMFADSSSFNHDVSSWNVSSVTNMAHMFHNTHAFNQSLSSWNTASVTNMSYMFLGASSFNQPLNWNTASVTDMTGMFWNADSFNGNISFWDVSSVTDMTYMFYNAPAFNQPLNWVPSSVTNMTYMFYNADSFNGDISSWDVSSVTDMYQMFHGASSFNQPLNWNTASVTDMTEMFRHATNFNQPLDWDVSSVTSMYYMFYDTASFNGNISTWSPSSATDMSYMFGDAPDFNQDISSWNVSAATNMYGMFSNAISFNQPLDSWDVSSVTDMGYMFSHTSAFNQPLDSWDVSSVTDMAGMFLQASAFNQPLDSWNVSSVTRMDSMFSSPAFDQNLGNWYVVLDDTVISNPNETLPIRTQNSYLDKQNITYAVGGDHFEVINGALAPASVMPRIYNVVIKATGDDLFGMSNSRTITITSTIDTAAPTFVSALYSTGDGRLVIAFNEPLNGTVHYNRMHIRDTGHSSGGIPLNAITDRSASGATLALTLSPGQQTAISNMDAPQLDIAQDAVFDGSGNGIAAISDRPISIRDTTLPQFTSATYTTGDGRLVIAFNEPLNGTVHYNRMHIRDTGHSSGGIPLNAITDRSASGATLALTLSPGQQTAISNMDAPQLDIAQDAVFDGSGNGIAAISDRPISIRDTTLPQFTSATYTTGDGRLVIAFNEPLNGTVHYNRMHIRDTGHSSGGIPLNAITDRSASGATLALTLSPGQQTAISNMDAPQLDIAQDAVFDGSGNGIAAISDRPISIRDTTLPQFTSATYTTGDGRLVIAFNEPLNGTVHYDMMHVRDTGRTSGGIALDTAESRSVSSDRLTLVITLAAANQTAISGMDTPQLDIAQDAVFDGSGNGIAAISDRSISIRDTLADAFITTWRTTAANQAIIIPTGGSNATFTINWGDGRVSTDVSGNVGRVYADPGNYTISITGGFERFILAQVPTNASMLMSIDQWGNASWTGMDGAFLNAANMVYRATDAPDLSRVTSMIETFRGASSFNGDLSSWDVSKVTDMTSMFLGASSFNGNISSWNTASVTDMTYMFYNAPAFNQPLNWNTASVTNMSYMFLGASAFNQPLNWNPASVTDMTGMFWNADSFNGNISSWDVSSVTNMTAMFYNAPAFNQPLNWNPASTTDMSYMFYNADSFNGNISSWDVSKVTDMYQMFHGASAFNQPLNWNTASVTDMTEMFRHATNFNQPLDWDVSSVTSMYYMFYDTASFNGNISTWSPSSATDMSYMFGDAPDFNQDISSWNVSAATNMYGMFSNAISFNQPLDSWDVSSVTDMGYMFSHTSAFNQPLDSWDVSSVTDMAGMFLQASAFNQPLDSWDVSSATNMYAMFHGASAFNQPLDSWDVSSVTDMDFMFYNANTFYRNLGAWYVVLDEDSPTVSAGDSLVGNITAQNSYLAGQNPRYSVSGANANLFEIVNNKTLQVKPGQDVASGIYEVSVQATGPDLFGTSNSKTVFVTSPVPGDTAPPTFISASYSTGAGKLTITFNETISRTVHYDRMHIRDVGQSTGGLSLDGASFKTISGNTITLILSTEQQTAISAMGTPQLDIDAGAVSDISNNQIAAAPDQPIAIDNSAPPSPFVTTWNIDHANAPLTIRVGGSNAFYTIDWGDGAVEKYVSGDQTHFYTNSGDYTVSFSGDFNRIYLRDTSEVGQLVSVDQWGDIMWTSMEGAFYGTNMTIAASDVPDLSRTTSMRNMFTGSSVTGDMSNWNVSSIVDMSRMFFGTVAFNQDISSWNVSSVTDMSEMFRYAATFNQDISSWDVSSVTDMSGMFANVTEFNQPLDWDVSSVTDMSGMFANNVAFNQDISSWNVSSVTDMSGMFYRSYFFNQDISSWNVSSVTDMSGMFNPTLRQNLGAWYIVLDESDPVVSADDSLVGNITAQNSYLAGQNPRYSVSGANANLFEIVNNKTLQVKPGQDVASGIYEVSVQATGPDLFGTSNSKTVFVTSPVPGDTAPPTFISASYSTGAGKLTITFNETISRTVHYDRMHIRDAGQSTGGLSLDGADPETISGNATTLILSTEQQTAISAMGTPQLDIDAGAVSDINNNQIAAAPDQPIEVSSPSAFVTTWRTTTPHQNITIPVGGSNATYTIDWGDGTVYEDVTGNQSHGYATPGDHTISISGNFERLELYNSRSGHNLRSIDQWGDISWTSMEETFRGTSVVIAASDVPDLSRTTSMRDMFSSSSVTVTGDISNWDTSSITDMSGTFWSASSFAGDISNWNTSSVTDMSNMFNSASSFAGDISNWNTSSVTDMSNMFNSASSFAGDISNWNTSSVTDMSYMFWSASSFAGDISNWNTSSVTDMAGMFDSASSFNGDISNWDTSLVTDMSWMFAYTNSFNQDISSWDVSSANDMSSMFALATSFNQNLGDWYVVLNDTVISDTSEVISIRAQNSFLDDDFPTYELSDDYFELLGHALAIKSGQGFIPGTYNLTISVTGSTFGTDNSRTVSVTLVDDTKPTFTSASYLTGAGRLTLEFSESLNGTIHYDRMHIRDVGQSSGGVSLDGAASKSVYGDTITLILSASQQADISAMRTPQLDIDAGAVFDLSGNDISAVSDHLVAYHDIPATAFVTTWRTTEANQLITIPVSSSSATYTIDWGDNTTDTDVSSSPQHSYTAAGDYTVSITGGFDRININYDSDADKLISIDQWGNASWTDMNSAFAGATNVVSKATDAPDLTKVTDMSYMFNSASSFNGDISSWNVSSATSMYDMFNGASAFNQNLGAWYVVLNDTTITSPSETLQILAQNPFLDGQSPTYTVDQNAGDGSFFKMVGNTLALKSDKNFIHGTYDVTIRVTDSGSGLFGTNNNLPVQIMVLDHTPPALTSASYLTGAGRLTLEFSESLNGTIHYDRMHIRDVGQSSGGVSLDGAASKSVYGDTITLILSASQQADISAMRTPQLDIDAGAVFDLSGNDISAVSDHLVAYHDIPATAFVTTWRTTEANQLITIPVSSSSATYTIDWGDNTTDTDVSSSPQHSYTAAGDYTVSITGGFDRININYDSDADKLISIDQWGNASWTDMNSAFAGATNVVSKATDAPDLTKVTDMTDMFNSASSFNGDLSSWDVSSVTQMFGMFRNAASFNGDISAWNVSVVTNMGSMFETANAFNGDISAWNVSAVDYMANMFYNATSFNGDISRWDTSSVNDMSYMFWKAASFNQDISSWNVSSVNNMAGMFDDARSFNQNLGNWYVVLADTTISSHSETLYIQAQNYDLDGHFPTYVVDETAGDGSYFTIDYGALVIKSGQSYTPGTYNVTIKATGSDLFGANNAREVSITVAPQTNTRMMSITANYDVNTRTINVIYSEPINGTVQANRFHIRDGTSGLNFALSTDQPVQRGVDTRLRGTSGLNFAFSGEPRISNDTISFVLNRPLDVILRNMAVPLLDIGQGATYDTHGNMLPAIADHPIYIPDTFPPTLDSAVYKAGSLELAFSEPLNATVLPDRMQVRNGSSGQGIPLSNIPFGMLTAIPAGPSPNMPAPVQPGTILAFWPNNTVRHVIQNMTAPTVLIFEAAVSDLAGNPIAATDMAISTDAIGQDLATLNGTSTANFTTAQLTYAALPPAPTNLRATSTAYSVTLTWDAPNDSTITGYKILSRIPATQPKLITLINDTDSADPTYTIPNLEPDTAYTFRVVAMSEDGQSQPSRHTSISTKDPPPPAIPTNLRATSTDSSVTLAWDDPDDDTITGYKILSRESATQPTLTVLVADTGSADPTYTIPNLKPGAAYVFRIIALGHGESPRSASVAISTTSSPSDPVGISRTSTLSPPTNLRATSTAYSVTLTWDDPDDDTITGYEILSRIPATQPKLITLINDTDSADPTYTIPNLEPDTAYTFRVVAMSEDGQSQPSRHTSISTKDPPPPAIPTNLRATSTDSSVTLTWDDPNDSTITGYKILSRESATQPTLTVLVADTGSADPTYTIPNLKPGAAYVFRIIALGHGESPRSASVAISTTSSPSDPVGISPKSPLSPPTNLRATSTAYSVTLAWDDPNDDTITGYKILSRIPAIQPDLHTIVSDTGSSATKYTIPNLEPDTAYTFRVVAMNEDGQSQPSRFTSISTKDPPPPAIPTNLRATSTAYSVTLTWDDPDDDTITGYEILSRTPATQSKLSTLISDTGSTNPTYAIPNLEPDTAYIFRIIALSDYGESKFSDPARVSTLPDRPPAITLAGHTNMTIPVGSTYAEPGYTATDDHDGDVTASVTITGTVDSSTIGTYTIRYDVADSSGNPAVQQVRTVRVVDTTPPAIILSGSASMSIPFNTTYAEPGYTATDDYDGDITGSVRVSGTVDSTVPGTYTIQYDVADSSGNAAETRIRTVTVEPVPISNPIPPSNSTNPVPPVPPSNSTNPVPPVPPSNSTNPVPPVPPSNSTNPVPPVPPSNSTNPVPPVPPSNSTNPVPPVPPSNSTNPVPPVPPSNSTNPITNSTAVNGPPMTPSETRGIRGLAPDAIQSGAIRISWETLYEMPRDYRVSWAKTAEPFLA